MEEDGKQQVFVLDMKVDLLDGRMSKYSLSWCSFKQMPITLAVETSHCSAAIIEFTVISDKVKTKAVLL